MKSCIYLKNCVTELKRKASKLTSTKAFFQYLDDAPKVSDPENAGQCGDLREYFDYDRNFVDDERICEEVKSLECFNDFSNLDGLATGAATSDEILIMNTNIRVKKKCE